MSKKKRAAPPAQNTATSAHVLTKAPTAPLERTGSALPVEARSGDWTAVLFALMMFLAPALGVPDELMLQDTLKSIVVSVLALSALVVFFWREQGRTTPLRWHGIIGLPLALMAYALGSMVWSHVFLGGVEAIRWFVFSVIVWLGLNSFSRERFSMLAIGIHTGALVASIWTAWQFWADFKGFPQGPNPASTFVNRNFFAEFLVCTLPFSVWLLLRARANAVIVLMSFTTGFNLVAMLMTGTRSALIALAVLVVLLPVMALLYRQRLAALTVTERNMSNVSVNVFGAPWSKLQRSIAAGVLIATVIGLGSLGTGNAALIEEHRVESRGLTPIARSFARALSMTDKREYTERSFSLRWVMWSATGRMIADNPLAGVGAGAWEVQIPRYQASGAQLETDYYVHNEVLQLLAEYGLVGWGFLLALFSYLSAAAWKTLRATTPEALAEAPLRAFTLTSLLLFLIISNAGFPWRLAATGALFAVCLGILAASDARLGWTDNRLLAGHLRWSPLHSKVLLGASAACLALCLYISQQAAEAENKIVNAVKLALTVSASNQVHSPRWKESKVQMFQLLREGIAITPHYRKLTPMVADEVAKWGDWTNATWIWESVTTSRPYVVAIMSNIARGYSQNGQFDKAFEFLERCKHLQPNAASVRSLEVILLSRTGRMAQALALARRSLDEGVYDYDLVNAAYVMGLAEKEWDVALKGLTLRSQYWPATVVDGWVKTGLLYTEEQNPQRDEAKALAAFQRAYDLALVKDKDAVKRDVPAAYRSKLRATQLTPVAQTPHSTP